MAAMLVGCGSGEKSKTESVEESTGESVMSNTSDVKSESTGSTAVEDTGSTVSESAEKSFEQTYLDSIKSMDVRLELKETKEKIESVTDGDTFNYAFITDTHTDTTQSEGNYELVANSIEYMKFLGKTGAIDCIVIGGDQVTGWFEKQRCIDTYSFLVDKLKDSPVPVIMVKGNHDNNINVPGEELADPDLFSISQAPFINDRYVYDTSVKNGFYFYVDFPDKKTRLICLDSFESPLEKQQSKWLAEKAFTVKDEGWKYVLVMHVPIDLRYEAEMPHVCSGAADIKKMVHAINNHGKAECSFGTYDFSGFKSQVVVLSCGHTHSGYMEYNEEINSVCTVTGCSGAVGDGKFDYVEPDDDVRGVRQSMSNAEKDRYLVDIFSVSNSKVDRIRFGNGIDKNIPLK